MLRNVLIPSRLQREGEAVKAFYRNGLMRALKRAREISFTFTPRRLYRPLRSESAASTLKDHVVCARVRRLHCAASFARAAVTAWRKRSPLPRTDAFCRCRKSRGLARPPIAFSARDAPLVGKEITLSKNCGSAGARSGGNGGGERSVHIGTTKG